MRSWSCSEVVVVVMAEGRKYTSSTIHGWAGLKLTQYIRSQVSWYPSSNIKSHKQVETRAHKKHVLRLSKLKRICLLSPDTIISQPTCPHRNRRSNRCQSLLLPWQLTRLMLLPKISRVSKLWLQQRCPR
jgi:hypothetical protein